MMSACGVSFSPLALVSAYRPVFLTPRVVTRRNAGVRGVVVVGCMVRLVPQPGIDPQNRPCLIMAPPSGMAAEPKLSPRIFEAAMARPHSTGMRQPRPLPASTARSDASPQVASSEVARWLWAARHSQGLRLAHGTQPGAAQDAVDYLQESSRNHVRGHNRAQSARSKAPVVMAEPHHVFRSFPTTQVVWYTACKHAILMCVHTEVCVCHVSSIAMPSAMPRPVRLCTQPQRRSPTRSMPGLRRRATELWRRRPTWTSSPSRRRMHMQCTAQCTCSACTLLSDPPHESDGSYHPDPNFGPHHLSTLPSA